MNSRNDIFENHASLDIETDNKPNMLMPSFTMKGIAKTYKKKSARKWVFREFQNQARKDSLTLRHWRPENTPVYSESNPYPFSKLSTHTFSLSISEDMYKQYLEDDTWDYGMTKYLFKLCSKYLLSFPVVFDRFSIRYPEKLIRMEDMKRRFCTVCNIYNQVAGEVSGRTAFTYDREQDERRRKLLDLFHRQTLEQIEEEEMLIAELNKINSRKEGLKKHMEHLNELNVTRNEPLAAEAHQNVEREDDGSDKSVESMATAPACNLNNASLSLISTPAQKKNRANTKRTMTCNLESTPSASVPAAATRLISSYNRTLTPFRFPETKSSGVSLRSNKLKIPQTLGSRKTKVLENSLIEHKIDLFPPPTAEICELLSKFRSETLLLNEVKQSISNHEYEYQSLRHKFITLFPDISFPYSDEIGQEKSCVVPSAQDGDTSISDVLVIAPGDKLVQ